VENTWKHFELYEAECKALLETYGGMYMPRADQKIMKAELGLDRKPMPSPPPNHRFPLLGAYDLCLKSSHLFNILDARGAISVTERVGVIARVRALAVGIAKAWVDQKKSESAAEKSDEPEPGVKMKLKKVSDKLSPVGS